MYFPGSLRGKQTETTPAKRLRQRWERLIGSGSQAVKHARRLLYFRSCREEDGSILQRHPRIKRGNPRTILTAKAAPLKVARTIDGLTLLVVGTAFASFLVPASIVLFYFSPVTIWRTPLFILNVLAIVMGLAEQSLYVYVIINTAIIGRLGGAPPSLVITIVLMDFLVPICVEGILLVRVVAVYPPTGNSRRQNFAIYAPVVAFKIARLVNAVFGIRDMVDNLRDSLDVISAAQFVWSTKYVKIEWLLQLFDDIFVSALFIHRLRENIMSRSEAAIHTACSGSGSSYSWTQRVRTLYYIAISNFIFPILFNVAEIFIIFFDSNFFHGAIVVTVNCYVTIIGVLLATIWAQGAKRQRAHRATTAVLTSVEFARPAREGVVEGSEDEGHPTGPILVKIPVMREGWEARSSIRGGKRVLVKSLAVGSSTAMHAIVVGGLKEKRVSDLPSSSGAAVELEPSQGVRCNAGGADDKRAHASASVLDLKSRGVSGSVVARNSILDAV